MAPRADEVRDRIERLVADRCIELFARETKRDEVVGEIRSSFRSWKRPNKTQESTLGLAKLLRVRLDASPKRGYHVDLRAASWGGSHSWI
jgi:hypothetical protein